MHPQKSCLREFCEQNPLFSFCVHTRAFVYLASLHRPQLGQNGLSSLFGRSIHQRSCSSYRLHAFLEGYFTINSFGVTSLLIINGTRFAQAMCARNAGTMFPRSLVVGK